MATSTEARVMEPVSERLRFHPEWVVDPVPDWFMHHLDKNAIRDLAISQMNMKHAILEAQLRSLDQALAIISKTR